MKYLHYVFIFAFLGISELSAQEDWALLQRKAEEIFQVLVETKGYRPYPILSFSDKFDLLAEYHENTIVIGKKTLSICQKFEARTEDALATLIGHELSHYYAKDSIKKENFFDSTRTKQERAADREGTFIALSAGYHGADLMPQMLDFLHEDSLSSHSLEPRKQLARKGQEEAQELYHRFEMANYLSMIDEYALATDMYSYILEHGYIGKEIYTNMGVGYVRHALEYFNEREIPWAYPLELEVKTGLVRGGSGLAGKDRYAKADSLLKLARMAFRQAIHADFEDPSAWLNLACVEDVIHHRDTSFQHSIYNDVFNFSAQALKLAEQNQNKQALIDALQIRAIAFYKKGTAKAREQAHALLQLACDSSRDQCSSLLAHNGEKMGYACCKVTAITTKELPLESLDEIDLSAIKKECEPDVFILDDDQNKNLVLGIQYFPNSIAYMVIKVNPNADGKTEKINTCKVVFQKTSSSYPQASLQHIRIGDSYQQVLQAYEIPNQEFRTSQRSFLLYESIGLIFQLGRAGRVENWCLYY